MVLLCIPKAYRTFRLRIEESILLVLRGSLLPGATTILLVFRGSLLPGATTILLVFRGSLLPGATTIHVMILRRERTKIKAIPPGFAELA
jgi:hypothetical protein